MKKYRNTSDLRFIIGDIYTLIEWISNVVGNDCSVVKINLNDRENIASNYDYDDFANDLDLSSCPYITFILYEDDSSKPQIDDIKYIGISKKGSFYPKDTSECEAVTFYGIKVAKYIPLPMSISIQLSLNEEIDISNLSVLCLLFDGNCDVALIDRIEKFMEKHQSCNIKCFFNEDQVTELVFALNPSCDSWKMVSHILCDMRYIEVKK